MITNLLATILISVVTNWTEIYEQVPINQFNDQQYFYYLNGTTSCNAKFLTTDAIWHQPKIEYKNGKYLGKDGMVVKITEIKFDYENKERIHRIEENLYLITMRCHEKSPTPIEYIWDSVSTQSITELKISATNFINVLWCVTNLTSKFIMTSNSSFICTNCLKGIKE